MWDVYCYAAAESHASADFICTVIVDDDDDDDDN
jgi:hypothetical protein